MSRTTRTERSASWKTSAGRRRLRDALLEHLVQLEQVQQLALEVGALGALRGGADDRAGALQIELRRLLAQPVALLVVEPARDADALAVRRVDHVAAGDRQIHRQPRALGLQRVLDDLHDDLLARLEQVGDLAALAGRSRGRGGAPRRPGARSRRRAGSRSSPGRCRRTPPRARRARCPPGPCRCCRRSSGRRGARGRARRRGSRRRAWWAYAAGARRSRASRGGDGSRRLQQRDPGLPAVDADQYLLLQFVIQSFGSCAAPIGARACCELGPPAGALARWVSAARRQADGC